MPHQDIVWAPDGKSLLVGIYGENAGSGDPQNDYFRLNPTFAGLHYPERLRDFDRFLTIAWVDSMAEVPTGSPAAE